MKGKGKKVDVSLEDMNTYIADYRKLHNIPDNVSIPFTKRMQIVLSSAAGDVEFIEKTQIIPSYVTGDNF